MKQVTKKNYKEATIRLWGHLADHNHIRDHGERIYDTKNRVLSELGYLSCLDGCPLCQVSKYEDITCVLEEEGICRCEDETVCGYAEVLHCFMRYDIIDSTLAGVFLKELKLKLGKGVDCNGEV